MFELITVAKVDGEWKEVEKEEELTLLQVQNSHVFGRRDQAEHFIKAVNGGMCREEALIEAYNGELV